MTVSYDKLIEKSQALADEVQEYHLKGIGKIEIKPVSRRTALRVAEMDSLLERECLILQKGIANPKMNLKEVKEWILHMPGGLIEDLSETISEISGFHEEADKEAVHRFPEKA